MGTWGPKLYEDDIAEDIRYSYMERLRKGKSGDEATQEVLNEYRGELSDPDDASIIWFALADTQWNVGRLEDGVKDKALYYIEEGSNLKRWKKEAPALYEKRATALEQLKNKLLSPQPPMKKFTKRRSYHCQWNLGDVFAYQLSGDVAQRNQLKGKYLFFVKVGEDNWVNDCVIPIIYVYWVISDKVISVEELENIGYIPQFTVPEVYLHTKTRPERYRLSLLSTSSRVIPKKNLTYIGKADLRAPLEEPSLFSTFKAWKDFEEYIIKDFQNWDGYQYLTER